MCMFNLEGCNHRIDLVSSGRKFFFQCLTELCVVTSDTGMLALNKLMDSFGAGLPQKFNLLPFSCLGQVN